MKLLYFTGTSLEDKARGVTKKILTQVNTFKGMGLDVDCLYVEGDSWILEGDKKYHISKRRPTYGRGLNVGKVKETISSNKYDVIYVRYFLADSNLIKILKFCKSQGMKTIVEIPTYPYDIELNDTLKMRIRLMVDKVYRTKLKAHLDRIVTYSLDDFIYGVPTIKTGNGVAVDDIEPVNHKMNGNDIHLIAVASMDPFHGYERLINGISEYYKKGGERNVIFHLVGQGKETKYYKQIVNLNGINEHVIFHGKKYGDDLDKIFDTADIGIASLAFYKIGLNWASSLKVGEYLSRGLPVVTGCEIKLLNDSNFKDFLKFENNDSVVSLDKIIQFYDLEYPEGLDKNMVVKRIRSYAYEHCDMKVVMKGVQDFIGTGN